MLDNLIPIVAKSCYNINIMAFHERHHRTFFKSVSWFIVGFAISFFVLQYFTGNIKLSLIEASAIQALKFIFFYIHERLWNKSHFGKEVKAKGLE
jgi:uncharacterized membrane protein